VKGIKNEVRKEKKKTLEPYVKGLTRKVVLDMSRE